MLISIKKAVEVTGLSEWELRRGIKTGEYPAMKIGEKGGKYLIDPTELDSAIKTKMQFCEGADE